MSLVLLAMLGVVEAVVWLWRMRTHRHESAVVSALAAGAVTVCRLLFVYAGASAVLAEVPVWQALAAYVLPAAVATGIAHRWADKPKAKLPPMTSMTIVVAGGGGGGGGTGKHGAPVETFKPENTWKPMAESTEVRASFRI
jgi:hypothetical protein